MAKRPPEHGRYSKVSRRMWNDAKVRALSWPAPNGLTLWQRLLTGPDLGCIPGLFQAWEAGLAQALGWDLKGFREAFGEVLAQGLAEADWRVGLVWVPKAIEHNRPESPNVVRSWKIQWEEMPECDLKLKAYSRLKAFTEGMGEGFAKAFAESCPKPSVNPCPNQEQEQEQEQKDPPLTPPVLESPQPSKPKRSRRKPQTPMPADLAPLERQAELALKRGLDLDAEFERFRAHHESKDSRFADWHRAFDTWLGNASAWQKPGQPPGLTAHQARTGIREGGINADWPDAGAVALRERILSGKWGKRFADEVRAGRHDVSTARRRVAEIDQRRAEAGRRDHGQVQ